jgi:pyruvate ferredoxin oxidoreductase beta subunit
MARPLPVFKELALADDAFGPGHSLCPGCQEAVTFHTLGRASDNGAKTVLVMNTSCGEVSTLQYPDRIAWGRGAEEPERLESSLGVIHHVFESAPSVAEGVRDAATVLAERGAWTSPTPNVLVWSGDGGALTIGLRALLHTIYRRARLAIFVNINEVFANTGFQYCPSTIPLADSSTRPGGVVDDPLDYVGLALVAGARYVAQASPAFAPFFAEVVREALSADGTAVVFVPSPCIAGWKFEDGLSSELGKLGCQTGLYPGFRWKDGAGELKHVPEKARRPPVEKFLALQERFRHVVGDPEKVAALQAYADRTVERFARWTTFRR